MRELTVAEQRYQAVLAVISDGLAVSLVAQKAGVSRLGAEQSAKLCVQYLAPIFKNRQYNFFPIGETPSMRVPHVVRVLGWLSPPMASVVFTRPNQLRDIHHWVQGVRHPTGPPRKRRCGRCPRRLPHRRPGHLPRRKGSEFPVHLTDCYRWRECA
jgi:hypothetical protein